ncbi:hypothetical protein LZ22198_MCBDPFMK_02520 [Levilactobacillus zymae]
MGHSLLPKYYPFQKLLFHGHLSENLITSLNIHLLPFVETNPV